MSDSPQESQEPSHTSEPPASHSNGNGRYKGGLTRRFIDILAWVITGLWILSFLFDAFIEGYDTPATIQALMMVVAGAAFGSSLIQKGE